MSRIALTEAAAARNMFAAGFTVEQVQAFIDSQRGQCAVGYVWADMIPMHETQKIVRVHRHHIAAKTAAEKAVLKALCKHYNAKPQHFRFVPPKEDDKNREMCVHMAEAEDSYRGYGTHEPIGHITYICKRVGVAVPDTMVNMTDEQCYRSVTRPGAYKR